MYIVYKVMLLKDYLRKSAAIFTDFSIQFHSKIDINKLIKDIELPREWQKLIKGYCDEIGIE